MTDPLHPPLPRRQVLTATGLGIASLALPRSAAHASSAESILASYSTTPAVDAEGAMVLYVDAMNPASYPGSGTVWKDLSGDGNDVTFAANATQHPTFVTEVETSLSYFTFDGNDYFDISLEASRKIANTSPYTGSTGYSVEAWVWDDLISSGSRNIVSGGDKFLFLNGTTLQAGGRPTAGGAINYGDLTSASFPKGQWTFVAFAYDTANTRAALYVNGVQVASKTTNVNYVADEALAVGAHNLGTPTSFWRGRMTEIRIYARELTAAQVTANYDATKGRYPAPS
jgi:hypothetical protein